jgi:hypothetical protein
VQQSNFNEYDASGQECIGENSKVNFGFRQQETNRVIMFSRKKTAQQKQDFAASGTELVNPSAASTCSRVGPFPRKEYCSSKTWGVGVR